jgi:GntR family transcriptional regulator
VLNISRTTVRQAIELLVNDGLIIRYRGKGSFISNSKMKRPLNSLYNFTENMRELNVVPSSYVLKNEVIIASEDIRSHLKLPTTQNKIFYLERLRYADNKPVLLERTSIPYYLCQGIESYDFSTMSLYHVLSQNYFLNLYHATETIAAMLIRENEAKLLQCNTKDVGYKISRISYLDSEFIFEYTTSITRADMCEFQIELYKNATKHNNSPVNIRRNITL